MVQVKIYLGESGWPETRLFRDMKAAAEYCQQMQRSEARRLTVRKLPPKPTR